MGISSFFDYPGERDDSDDPAATAPLGDTWSTERWAQLLAFTEVQHVRKGEYLVRAGEREQALYILEAGTLEVVVMTRAGARRMAMEEGSLIGEVAFFDGLPRSADVIAATDARVRRLSVVNAERLSARHPDLARALLMELGRILAYRLRRAEALASA